MCNKMVTFLKSTKLVLCSFLEFIQRKVTFSRVHPSYLVYMKGAHQVLRDGKCGCSIVKLSTVVRGTE